MNTVTKDTANAIMHKLQKRKFNALKGVATFACVTSLAFNAKMDASAACIHSKNIITECIVGPNVIGSVCFMKEEPPTEAMSYVYRKQSYDYSEKELLAMYQVVQAEAGAESMRGKTAVASVILNRFFGDNNFKATIITDLIVPGQFARSNYSLEWIRSNNPSVIKAVEYAMNGYDPTAELYTNEGALYFYAEWNIGEYGETTIIEKGDSYKRIVIDRQAFYQ